MTIITNHTEYLDAIYKLNQYNFCVKEYCKNNKTNGIPVEITKTFPFANEIDNTLRSQVEIWEFRIKPPKKYFLYVNIKKMIVTTWTGDKLGDIIHLGNQFISNFGDKRQYLRIKAVNTLYYSGYYFLSSGDYARVKQIFD